MCSMYRKTSSSAYRMDPSNFTHEGPSPTLRQYRSVPPGIESISATALVVRSFISLVHWTVSCAVIFQLSAVPTPRGWETRNYLGDAEWFSSAGTSDGTALGTTTKMVPDGPTRNFLRNHLDWGIAPGSIGSFLATPRSPFVSAEQFYCALTVHANSPDNLVLGQAGRSSDDVRESVHLMHALSPPRRPG